MATRSVAPRAEPRPAPACRLHLRVRCQPAPASANPGVKREIYVGQPVRSHHHLGGLHPDTDRLIRNHEVGSGRRVDEKVPRAVAGKPGDNTVVLLERKFRLERRVTGLIRSTDGLHGPAAGGSFQPRLGEATGIRLHWKGAATGARAGRDEERRSEPSDHPHCRFPPQLPKWSCCTPNGEQISCKRLERTYGPLLQLGAFLLSGAPASPRLSAAFAG